MIPWAPSAWLPTTSRMEPRWLFRRRGLRWLPALLDALGFGRLAWRLALRCETRLVK